MSYDRGERPQKVDLGDLSLVRYKSHGKQFEMVVNPEKAWDYIHDKNVPLDEVVEGYVIFDDFRRGMKASTDDLIEVFGTDDEIEIAKIMLEKGNLLITQEMRRRFLEEKIKEIVDYIVKYTVNPKTGAPHTPARIEKAMEEAGVKISRNKPASEQAPQIINELTSVIPIKMEVVTIEFKVPASFAASLYGYFQSVGEMIEERWESDGSLVAVVKLPGGLMAPTMEEVSTRTKGKAQIHVLKRG